MDRTRLAQLAVLATVAETGGFRAAADRLGVAPSAVSHAVSALEASLGLRLLARTTRSVRPTPEGRQLLDRVTGPLSDIAAALAEAPLTGEAPAGTLAVTMPLYAAELVILPRLAGFRARFPGIELDLRAGDAFEDIVAQGCDAGLRLGETLEQDMIAVPAGPPLSMRIVGSPAYFARHPAPTEPSELTRHDCIRRRFASGRLHRWELEKDGRALTLDLAGGLILPQQALMHRAALDGLGLAQLFEPMVAADIAAGRLVAVMQDWCPPFPGFHIYYPSRRQMRPALRAFVDFFRHRG